MVKLVVILFTACCMVCVADGPASQSSKDKESSSWKEEYTVGPGDTFRVEIYGKPETQRLPVLVQPDGTLSYLQAQNIPVTGMTIEGVRAELQKTLEHSYKNIEVIVQPLQLQSKKYFVLG